jgi:hypothetical protein
VTGKKYFSFKDVPVQNNRLQISASSLGDFLKKSGRYTLDIESGELAGETRFTISPSTPHHIVTDIPTLLLKDKKQSIAFSLQDIYNNELALDNWSFDITTSDPIILHDIGEKEGTQFSAKFKSNFSNFSGLE